MRCLTHNRALLTAAEVTATSMLQIRFVVGWLVVGAGDKIAAQSSYPPERSGLVASVSMGRAALSLEPGPFESKRMLSTRLGLRINPLWCTTFQGFRVTPHLAFATTDFRGMDSLEDKFALSDLEKGVEVSLRV